MEDTFVGSLDCLVGGCVVASFEVGERHMNGRFMFHPFSFNAAENSPGYNFCLIRSN